MSISNLDIELLGTLNNLKTLSSRDIVGNFSGKDTVVHQEHINVTDIGHNKLLETIGEEMTGLGVGSVTNLGHGDLALETTTDTVINTLGLSPAGLLFLMTRRMNRLFSRNSFWITLSVLVMLAVPPHTRVSPISSLHRFCRNDHSDDE